MTPFDYGEQDLKYLKEAQRKSSTMKKQVTLAYKVGCLSRCFSPYANLEKLKKR
jgi:hypothetical protein